MSVHAVKCRSSVGSSCCFVQAELVGFACYGYGLIRSLHKPTVIQLVHLGNSCVSHLT